MKRLAACLLLAGLALPALAASQVTVEQLELALAKARTLPDAEVARQIDGFELSERLDSDRLEQLRVSLPGPKSQHALIALADSSAFLDPPVADIPATATPDAPTQRRMMALTVDYLGKTLPLLPNLFAARDTMRFETRPDTMNAARALDNPLREASKSRVTVLYRDGREFVDAGAQKYKARAPDKGLATWGEFGPILGTVLLDAAHSRLAWSHWERAGAGPQAVFKYAVPKEKSHYDVRFCCAIESYGFETSVLTERVGYHGQITVDPDSGTILRLTVLADVTPGNPIGEANIAVEYGPVQIGGKTYFCPVRGIALAQAPDLKGLRVGASPGLTPLGEAANHPAIEKASLSAVVEAPRQTFLNDVAFREYHLFRAESKLMIPNAGEAARSKLASLALPADSASGPPANASQPEKDTAVESSSLVPGSSLESSLGSNPGPIPGSATESADGVSGAGAPSGAPPEPLIPEMTVSSATGLPNLPAVPQAGSDSSVTLRLNARLVDVPLVALDKKGRPITNLKPEDLVVFDNGVKVDLHSFTQAESSAHPSQAPAVTSGVPSTLDQGSAFSNRTLTAAQPAVSEPQGNFIALLIDSTLSFDDLSNTREQMGTFLKSLDADERVALYVMRVGGFQILQEGTSDHALVASTLAKWTPSAQNISLAQEQEARNRQTMDYVRNTEDLLDVNGNRQMDTTVNEQATDPQLRTLGDNPGRDALSILVNVARHLGSIPGHKSLVWIASDNTLADWTNGSINIDKGSRIIQAAVLHAQESMNDAHASVYPLDASRLEAGGIDASIGNRNVVLNPTATANQIGFACGAVGPGGAPETTAGGDITTCNNDQRPGRSLAQMQQDLHAIQGAYRELADATGGRTFRRSSDMVSEFKSVVADGRATYLLSFSPAAASDGKYHLITVKMPGRKDVRLQYRTGFFYREEPTAIKDRFRDAILEPKDATQVSLTANVVPSANGRIIKLGIAAADLAIAQKDAFWTDRVDVFLAQRQVSGEKARVTGQTIGLRLKPATYQQYLREGIPFNQTVEADPSVGSVRIVVVDENSGRMGSVTIPTASLVAQR